MRFTGSGRSVQVALLWWFLVACWDGQRVNCRLLTKTSDESTHIEEHRTRKRSLGDASLTTPELIRAQRYPVEVHHVTTKDGYVLEMHRIPHGLHNGPGALTTHAKTPQTVIARIPEATTERKAEATAEASLERKAEATTYATAERKAEATTDATAERKTDATAERKAEATTERKAEATVEASAERIAEATAERKTEATVEASAERIAEARAGRATEATSVTPRPVVYLQHCLLCSSSDWIMNTPDKALAYILADRGYDVWLGNARGNTYNRKHRLLQPEDPLFWQFSWSEMGKYDLPASIDYVLNYTQQEQLYYVGFSMGTTVFFTMMHYHPEYNDKIRGMVALAPVAYVTHMKGPLGVMLPYTSYIQTMLELAGMHELLPSGELLDMFVSSVCSTRQVTAPICHNLLFTLTGPDPEQLNQEYLPVILSHTPAGTSLRTLIHYMQTGQADKFQDYDYGYFGNFRKYGQLSPPEFNLTKVTAPVAVFYGENDWLATPEDVSRLLAELPNLVSSEKVKHEHFTHLDFVWALDAVSLVYDPLLETLRRF